MAARAKVWRTGQPFRTRTKVQGMREADRQAREAREAVTHCTHCDGAHPAHDGRCPQCRCTDFDW